jgi:hypothetical protein
MKLALYFSLIIFILFIVGIKAIFCIKFINKRYKNLGYDVNSKSILTQKMLYEASKLRTLEFQHISITDLGRMEEIETQMEEIIQNFNVYMSEYKDLKGVSFIQVEKKWPLYTYEVKTLIERSKAFDKSAALCILEGSSQETFSSLELLLMNSST